jgi:predicted nuclease of predicted toxin-antitoxin system
VSRGWLADENFPGPVIRGLIAAGHDVMSVALSYPGIDDRAVLDLACRTGRRLLTFDVDFGELVFSRGAPAPTAILYFRLHPIVSEEILELALRAVAQAPDGHFVVIGREGMRIRSLTPKTLR